MGWSKEQLTEWQITNNARLKEINESLRPDPGPKTGKIGIFLHGQGGDLATAMSVLKYRNDLWSGKEIIWFANWPNADLLRYAPISEVRPWPWAGNGLPEGSPDFYPLLCDENNRLNKELAKNYELTADLEDGYFPAPHMVAPEKRVGVDYPNVSRKIFGIDEKALWHPLLIVSKDEEEEINAWFPPYHAVYLKKSPNKLSPKPMIAIESFCGSGQSLMDERMIADIMQIFREQLGECYFIFLSHKFINGNEEFPQWLRKDKDVYFASKFTPRQCSYIISYCNAMISVSSGVSVVANSWQYKLRQTPMIQFCGSFTCSTASFGAVQTHLITTDLPEHPRNIEKERELGKIRYYEILKKVIETI